MLNDSYFHAARTLRQRCLSQLESKILPDLERDTAMCGLLVADALMEQNWPTQCRGCGDKLVHDDDGPTHCRFCVEYQPAITNAVGALQAIANNNSDDPVLANIEGAVRDVLASGISPPVK